MTKLKVECELEKLAGKHRAAYIGVVPVAGGHFTLSNAASPDAATADFLALVAGVIGGLNIAQAKVRDGSIKLSRSDTARLAEARNSAVALGSFLLNSFREVGK